MKRGMDGGSGVGGKKMKGDNVTLRFLLLSKVSMLAIAIFTITSPLINSLNTIDKGKIDSNISFTLNKSKGKSISKYFFYILSVFLASFTRVTGIQQE